MSGERSVFIYAQNLAEQASNNMQYLRERIGHLAASLLLVTSGSLAGFVAQETITETAAFADTGGYPEANVPCANPPYNTTGTCAGYNWRIPTRDTNGNITGWPEWTSRGYGARNCTDYVAWRIEKEFGISIKGLGDARDWDNNAAVKKWQVDSTPEVGDIAQWDRTDDNEYGHVAFVESVNNDGTVNVSDYNHAGDGTYIGPSERKNLKADHYIDINGPNPPDFHLKGGGSSSTSAQRSLLNLNPSSKSLSGHWMRGDVGEDFAYVTKNGDGGFSIATWIATTNGLVAKNVEWTQAGSSNVLFNNTVFMAADVDGDGLQDILYASSTDWDRPSFTVGILHNTGEGLEWVGPGTVIGGIPLKNVKFLPGDWARQGRQGFAYITRNPDGGFTASTFDSDPSSLGKFNWTGNRWTQAGDSGVLFDNTTFNQADIDGDGDLDLLYTTARDWNAKGFTMGEMRNDGPGQFHWGGTQWAESNLKLATTRIVPGKWFGGTRDGLLYITKRSDNDGYDAGSFQSQTVGLVWRGTWLQEPGLTYNTTAFVPADVNSDGYTDLLYATPANPGFAMALQTNRTDGNGFSWSGRIWAPTHIGLDGTGFLAGH